MRRQIAAHRRTVRRYARLLTTQSRTLLCTACVCRCRIQRRLEVWVYYPWSLLIAVHRATNGADLQVPRPLAAKHKLSASERKYPSGTRRCSRTLLIIMDERDWPLPKIFSWRLWTMQVARLLVRVRATDRKVDGDARGVRQRWQA